jgi:hypothetical protein
MRRARGPACGTLHDLVGRALDAAGDDLLWHAASVVADDERDALATLLELQDLWLAPTERLGARVRLHGHPAVAELKRNLESDLLARLRRRTHADRSVLPDGAEGLRRVAALDRVPAIYRWIEHEAELADLIRFVSLEGGPDAGFDDLVALAQVGVRGDPKLALAENYWDEMGRGTLDLVHTHLHDRLVRAVELPAVERTDLPVGALERSALSAALATDRSRQPELLGALGLIELQAGPRCRCVVRAMERLGAPAGALPFYLEHAETDPHHGKDWADRVVEPLSAKDATSAQRIVDGALWRHHANARFFDEVAPVVAQR